MSTSTNPLDCTCTYHSHRPPGQGTRTDVARNPRCKVHGTPRREAPAPAPAPVPAAQHVTFHESKTHPGVVWPL